jgi:Transposase DDE domain group 1
MTLFYQDVATKTSLSSQMGRFETEWIGERCQPGGLADLSGAWIDRIHDRKPPRGLILDMDSSERPSHGEQEGSAWNGHFGCTCYQPLLCSTNMAVSNAAGCGPAMCKRRRLAPGSRAGDRPLP